MVAVNVKNFGFSLNETSLKKKLDKLLKEKFRDKVEVDLAIVDEDHMVSLGKRYLNESGSSVHNVLSFPTAETKGEFIYPKDGVKRLGEVVICYPKALQEARVEGVAIDKKIYELAEHGLRHLLGEHHE